MRTLILGLMILTQATLCGCGAWTASLRPTHKSLEAPQTPGRGKLLIRRLVDKRADQEHIGSSKTGAIRFGVDGYFILPEDKPLGETLARAIGRAAEVAGYAPTFAFAGDSDSEGGTGPVPTLKGRIEKFWVSDHSRLTEWLQQGEAMVSLRLYAPDGKTLRWERDFKAIGRYDGPAFVFTGTDEGKKTIPENLLKNTLTDLLNQVVEALASQEFQKALRP